MLLGNAARRKHSLVVGQRSQNCEEKKTFSSKIHQRLVSEFFFFNCLSFPPKFFDRLKIQLKRLYKGKIDIIVKAFIKGLNPKTNAARRILTQVICFCDDFYLPYYLKVNKSLKPKLNPKPQPRPTPLPASQQPVVLSTAPAPAPAPAPPPLPPPSSSSSSSFSSAVRQAVVPASLLPEHSQAIPAIPVSLTSKIQEMRSCQEVRIALARSITDVIKKNYKVPVGPEMSIVTMTRTLFSKQIDGLKDLIKDFMTLMKIDFEPK